VKLNSSECERGWAARLLRVGDGQPPRTLAAATLPPLFPTAPRAAARKAEAGLPSSSRWRTGAGAAVRRRRCCSPACVVPRDGGWCILRSGGAMAGSGATRRGRVFCVVVWRPTRWGRRQLLDGEAAARPIREVSSRRPGGASPRDGGSAVSVGASHGGGWWPVGGALQRGCPDARGAVPRSGDGRWQPAARLLQRAWLSATGDGVW
jgi:hypothetical protein